MYAAPKKSSFAAKEPESIYKNMLKKGEQKQISLTSEKKNPKNTKKESFSSNSKNENKFNKIKILSKK